MEEGGGGKKANEKEIGIEVYDRWSQLRYLFNSEQKRKEVVWQNENEENDCNITISYDNKLKSEE